MKYIPVIGLEIHAELSTRSKVFCTCSAEFGGSQNTRCCPRCTGMPGTLPVLNKGAVELAVRAGLALGCDISLYSRFDRKNYFYPDLPKAYQISQFYHPICRHGGVMTQEGFVRIHHIHIEEDAGKLIHDDLEDVSLADYNRCGVPLIEIVTEPDIRSAAQAKEFVEAVALRLKYAGVCDCKMEEGSLRADVNISVMRPEDEKFGTRVEMKNLNSLKSIVRSIEYETERQSEALDDGEKVLQETRRFNDSTGDTKPLRSKEEAHDYRYFPEPDIPPILLTEEDIESIRSRMPQMPDERMQRYTGEYDLPEANAKLIVEDRLLSDFYDQVIRYYNDYKSVANFVVGELLHRLNDSVAMVGELKFGPESFARVVQMSDEGTVSKNAAKSILRTMFESGGSPMEIAEKAGLLMSDDSDAVVSAVEEALSQNQKVVDEYLAGSEKVFGFLMGQVSRRMGKGSNPAMIRKILENQLKKRKEN